MKTNLIAQGIFLVLAICSPTPSQEIEHAKGNISTKYDRFEDLTLVTADGILVEVEYCPSRRLKLPRSQPLDSNVDFTCLTHRTARVSLRIHPCY